MRHSRGFTLVSGPADGQRVALKEPATRWVVMKPNPPLSFAYRAHQLDKPVQVETIEYLPVRGIPGVLAPRGTPPELVIDMLVQNYA